MSVLKHVLALSVAFGLAGGAATAQSAAEIAAMVDKKMEGVDAFAALLNDPDPERSLAAMSIMIGHEDAQVSRMALQFGLTSTSPAVRRAALKAYLDSGANFGVYIDGSGFDRDKFSSVITYASGSVDAEGVGYLTYKVGPYDKENSCYDYIPNPAYCQIKLTEDALSISLWGKWHPMKLNADGILEGHVQVDRLTPSVPASIPVRP